MTTGRAPGSQRRGPDSLDKSLAAGSCHGAASTRSTLKRPRLPSPSSSLALALKQTLGARGWRFMLGEAETRTCLGSGSGAAPQPQHPPPRPSPALRGLLTSNGKSWWGHCSRRRDPQLASCPGTPNPQGESAAVCMDGSSIERLGSLLTVKGREWWVGHSPWVPMAGAPTKLIRPHQHHNTRP